ncbi:hypothetical protein [Chryseobacterium turcicum]|uniref:Uncharacterized protein n=1 Tax=Chryseobacterium turcicum TaxID=2898076 RepID=A0A9Q3V4F8_9FLAO|nr:hypothetical protein [Chryseobacterium turcicum]MCD1117110.1 hypothetical protein [Chryseobacterium turcicum]
MSCRQDDESLTEETFQSSLKENTSTELQRNASDSLSIENLETDPPRDGTHWKVDEANQTKKTDSLSLLLLDNPDNGPKDPPRDGTHWKGK